MDIVKADSSLADAYSKYVQICYNSGLDYYELAIDRPESFLNELIAHAHGEQLPEGWVRCSTYFCLQQGEIVGAIRLRHQSNDFIDNVIGHIGYETHPHAREKGVATRMLEHIKHNGLTGTAYIICEASNLASEAVMKKAGAILDCKMQESDGTELLRYTISGTR